MPAFRFLLPSALRGEISPLMAHFSLQTRRVRFRHFSRLAIIHDGYCSAARLLGEGRDGYKILVGGQSRAGTLSRRRL